MAAENHLGSEPCIGIAPVPARTASEAEYVQICALPEWLAKLVWIDVCSRGTFLNYAVIAGSAKVKTGKIAELFVYDNFNRVVAERVEAGDICAFTGLSDVGIGETVCARDRPNPLPTIEVSCFCLCANFQSAP